MYFVLSGEGPSDIGTCNVESNQCSGDEFVPGAMAVIVDQLVEISHGYSFLESGHYLFVNESQLNQVSKQLVTLKKSPRLPGLKQKRETGFFYKNARAIALIAKDKKRELKDDVVAVLFRDSDGTASADRGLWKDKRKSMIKGFDDEQFDRGIPMIPKPKSEAWLICALKENAYQHCNSLEDRSGSDHSPNNLKDELAEMLDGRPVRELPQMVVNREIDVARITMPSFMAFKGDLLEVI